MEARDLTQVVADTSDVGHLLLNHLGAVGVAVLVPLAMTVYGAALRRLGGGVPTTGAEFYVGNAGTGFAALPVAGSFVFPGLTPSAFTSLLIVSIIANLTLAVLAILLQRKVDEHWFWSRAYERGLKKGRTAIAVPGVPWFWELLLWMGVYALVGANVVMFVYGLGK